jgi:predicted metalloprotease with PDZ domain
VGTQPKTPIHYDVHLCDLAGHQLEVELFLENPGEGELLLRLPTWIPGSYLIREFSRHIQWVRATTADGHPLSVRRVDKATWGLHTDGGPVRVRWAVYAWDLSVRAAHVDQQHAYWNGTSLFLAVVGREGEPHAVRILPCTDPAAANWKVATTLPQIEGESWGYGTFLAQDYDELIDHPVEIADFVRVDFEACGVPHHVVLTGRFELDAERLVADLRPICETHIRFFGLPAPMNRYLFQVMVVGEGFGGLEHRASTSLLVARSGLPSLGMKGMPDGYRNFLGLCSHEYFHTWNVKRIKPAGFLPYDLRREAHTELLWAFEGITSYYDDLGLVRSGVIDTNSYLELLARTLTGVLRTPGRQVQSVVDASFDAWTRYYRQDEQSPNALVSYYTKGSLVGLCVDLALRSRTAGATSLDTLMRRLWAEYGQPAVGVPEDRIEAMICEIGGPDMAPLLDAWLRGTGELPVGELLATHGLELRLRPRESTDDKGGKASARLEVDLLGRGYLGLLSDGRGHIKSVLRGGPAHEAGLSAGDEVVAVDGLRLKGDLVALAADRRPGTQLELTGFRRDELFVRKVTLGKPPVDTASIHLMEGAEPAIVALRTALLGRA